MISQFVRSAGVMGAAVILSLANVGSSGTARADETASDSFVSEVRVGVLKHDIAFFGRDKEESIDVNAEILFRAPRWESLDNSSAFVRWFLSPRPHIGASVNTRGYTSLYYAGVTWDIPFKQTFFFEASFGGAVHDGEKATPLPNRKELGCRVLFRGAASLGMNVTDHATISLMLEHASNGGLCENNEGLNNAGVRLGYRF